MIHFTRLSIILLLLCIPFVQAFAGYDNGIIKGTVLTSDGKPADGVTIILKGTRKTAISDEAGSFTIRNVQAGTYDLVVTLMGYTPVQQQVTVTDDNVNTVTFRLSVSDKQLQEVEVTSHKNKFAKKESNFIARMPLSNLENPQVYTVVNKDLIADQVTVDYKDALRNAPGFLPTVSPAGTINGYLRGFNLGNYARNGMASQNWALADLVNVERLEVIKGPSGTLFGTSVGYFGGLLNQVTKKPFDSFKGEISAFMGSWGLGRLTADINAPLNDDKTALLRVNAAVHNENSFMDMGHQRSVTFAPAFAYKVSDRLTLNLEAEIYKGDRTQSPYPTFIGNTFKNFRDMPLDYYKSLGGDDIDAKQYANNYFAQAAYKISGNWTSTTNVSYSQNRVEISNQIYPRWVNDSLVNRTITNYGPRTFTSLQIQQNFTGTFMIGSFKNRLLAGIDVYQYDGRQRYVTINYDTININHPFKPISLQKVNTILSSANPTYVHAKQTSYSAYVSDVINLTSRLNVMLSLRLDRFENKPSVTNGVTGTNKYGQTALSPKLGLVYQVVKDQVSVFGNYMNSFSNQAPVSQPDGSSLTLEPIEANQWEAGVKVDVLDHLLNGTVSYYNIDVSNATRRTDDGFTVQDGTQRSKGFEVELAASPLRGLNITAGYGYNENVYRKATKALEGKMVTSAPRNILNAWISYKFTASALKNFGLGAGGNYVSDSYWDAANTFIIPSYTVVNATLFYDQPKWRIGLKVNNIGNEKYWNANGYAQAPRQWIGNVTFKF